jgi:uncharacterized protein YceH (UPF0502 family)
MSSVGGFDDTGERTRRIPRPLDPIEVRILGCLLEKQQTTPEYYPLTLNALVAACNQKSNREPAMEIAERDVAAALDRLQDLKFVWRVVGGRAVRFEHNLDRRWAFTKPEKSLVTLLLLRGAQTLGELRGRSDRMYNFETVEEVENTLREMSESTEPLVAELPRRSGQKESRWTHLVSGAPVDVPETTHETRTSGGGESLVARIERLEGVVQRLSEELESLKRSLGS